MSGLVLVMGMDGLSRDGGIESKWGKLEEEFGGCSSILGW